jgi:hypothetical protein
MDVVSRRLHSIEGSRVNKQGIVSHKKKSKGGIREERGKSRWRQMGDWVTMVMVDARGMW